MDKKKLIRELKRFKYKIEKLYPLQKMILFGSRANGTTHKDSDVDLIIVGNFKEKSNLKRAPRFYLEWDIDLPVDFICYTPEEYKKLARRITIVREAKRNGIEIK